MLRLGFSQDMPILYSPSTKLASGASGASGTGSANENSRLKEIENRLLEISEEEDLLSATILDLDLKIAKFQEMLADGNIPARHKMIIQGQLAVCKGEKIRCEAKLEKLAVEEQKLLKEKSSIEESNNNSPSIIQGGNVATILLQQHERAMDEIKLLEKREQEVQDKIDTIDARIIDAEFRLALIRKEIDAITSNIERMLDENSNDDSMSIEVLERNLEELKEQSDMLEDLIQSLEMEKETFTMEMLEIEKAKRMWESQLLF